MNKTELVAKLEELEVEFDPEAKKAELEELLKAKLVELEKDKEPEPEPEPEPPAEEKKTGKISKAELRKFPPLKSGHKAVRMTPKEAKDLQCWYDPAVGIGVIKG